MKVVALVSGGKDSCYAMMKCQQYGHEIVALANLMPVDDAQDELDSFMYQTVGHQIVVNYAHCTGIPLFRRRIRGSTRHYGLSYNMTPGDEVEDMLILLKEVKRKIPSVSAVSSGAIASDYQRLRVENVCSRLGLVSLAYLWKQDQSSLLQQMITSGIIAITVKVAALGLYPSKHLGKEIAELESHLHKLKELYGVNVCGEGGEYETLTLDCPLFKNARIVLDKFQTVLHSSDPIAPVGVLHPLEYHLDTKSVSTSDNDKRNMVKVVDYGSVFEVDGDWQDISENPCQKASVVSDLSMDRKQGIQISKSKKDDTFSISCWLQDTSNTSPDLVEDLGVVLRKLELLLTEYNCSWENVLYIHLYIANMNEFASANEVYLKFIRQEDCHFGVPSRSTIELPLSNVGLGKAYVEVLVSNDNTKKVLHVQSISEWAPSCIGPYSQATLHRDVLYMAGQLGLEPATMLLCDKGPALELEQALENSEAVAKSFNCSISTSAVSLVIYCSISLNPSDRITIENQMDVCLKRMKQLSDSGSKSNMPPVKDGPVILYVLVPDLPKRASVEIKPLVYTGGTLTDGKTNESYVRQDYWGFQNENWQSSCVQQCVISGKLCTSIVSITWEVAAKISSQTTDQIAVSDSQCKDLLTEEKFVRIVQFCIYMVDRVLLENDFSWDDVLNLRIYFATSLGTSHSTLSTIFTNVFEEFSQTGTNGDSCKAPMFNVVPVLGAGRSATSMEDILTCELFAAKS